MYRYEIYNKMTFFFEKGRKYRQITLSAKRKQGVLSEVFRGRGLFSTVAIIL
jgi:hypothetical protein